MIQRDSLTRQLYATDASMYEELPQGVAFPASIEEIQQLVSQANKEQFSITARSAGTSLAGQATGGGIIMDVSRHMCEILDVNVEEHYARVLPGVIQEALNRRVAPHNLIFGPDTSTMNRAMVGGMIGNNSAGSFSIKHKTTREHTLEIEAVLSDGSVAIFKALQPEELEQKKKLNNLEGHIYRSMLKLLERNKEQILANFPHPEIIRRNTGYALDRLCEMQPINPEGRPFNLCELLCGSEGTLALTASSKMNLVEKARHRILVIPQFHTLHEAMLTAVEAVKLNPSAVELVDDIILGATKGNIEQNKNRFFLEGEPECILIIEFDGNDEEVLFQKAQQMAARLQELKLGYHYPIVSETAKMNRVWELRKAGLGLLMGLGEDSRSPTFCEDTAVRVQDLPEYVKDFQKIMEKHNTGCVFYAHVSVGELHLRPVIDITKESGLRTMKEMAEEIAVLVRKYRGSLSGEHGDGRARAPYIEKVLGPEMMPILHQVKEIWDPGYIFNPGKIISPKPIDTNLRFSPSYKKPKVDTFFNWRKEGSFANATELCNGAGVCRKMAESGGTMCPSYMATKEEKDTTRGRANVFRQVFAGENPAGFSSPELREALDLCLSCKACKSECPANVDMAKMKAEFMHGWHERNGASIKERFFADAGKLFPLASLLPELSNKIAASGIGKKVLDRVFGIEPKRNLPTFAHQPFNKWFKKHQKNGALKNGEKVVLFVDVFTNYNEPQIGIAAVEVLEKMGFQVEVAKAMESGRPQLSKGFLDEAKAICTSVIEEMGVYADQEIPVIGLEPSEILTLRDEFLDLCEPKDLPTAKKLAINSFTFEEFIILNKNKIPDTNTGGRISLHGHCHTKALTGNDATVEALEAAGYSVEELKTGCCGMAGSFGYEKAHYDVSMEIGELVLFPQLREKKEELICAPGFSCRHQISDGVQKKVFHPAELIKNNLAN
ncbi:MAG: FAD-linked oxidase C-terminal domain-containing protein [Balneolaceae bacterium]